MENAVEKAYRTVLYDVWRQWQDTDESLAAAKLANIGQLYAKCETLQIERERLTNMLVELLHTIP